MDIRNFSLLFSSLFFLLSCASLESNQSKCEEFCSSRGEECVGVRATGTKARSMVLGRVADFSHTRNPYRCQNKESIEVD
jgi:hypothetical protein